MGAQGYIGPRDILFASAKIGVTITYLAEKLVTGFMRGKVVEQGNIVVSCHSDTDDSDTRYPYVSVSVV